MRSEPFAHAPSILPGETSQPVHGHGGAPDWSTAPRTTNVGQAAEKALDRREARRHRRRALRRRRARTSGSSPGKKSASGRPMVANDPHLSLPSPSIFYEVGIDVTAARTRLTLYGVSFPGAPAIVHGTNGHVSWGSTVNPTDVTDVYQEQLVDRRAACRWRRRTRATRSRRRSSRRRSAPTSPATARPTTSWSCRPSAERPAGDGRRAAPEQRAAHQRHRRRPACPCSSRASARRGSSTSSACSRRRDDVGEAIDAQRYFDFGAQNWMYADDRGNIGYKTSAEIPLREDLQAGTVAGLPPYFIRNGTGGNEWIADPDPGRGPGARRTRSCRSPRWTGSSTRSAAGSRTRTRTRPARRSTTTR